MDPRTIERAWQAYVAQQEATARGIIPALPEATSTVQLLFMLGSTGDPSQPPATAQDALAAAGITPDDGPDSTTLRSDTPPAPPRRHEHGRTKIPDTLRKEVIVLRPALGEFAGDARLKDFESSYRVGIRPAEIFAIEIQRPRHAIDLVNGKTRYEVAPPPAEMIERGLFAPCALAHILALKWERHVPFNRTTLFFARHGYELSKSTLSGASMRAEPLARTLVDAMVAHAKTVAPYLAIDATGAKVQAAERCTNGHTWMRFVEGVGVFVSFTAKHDATAANAQLDGWECPFLADGAAVFNDFERRSSGGRFGCYSHGRRKFFYAMASDPRALVGIKLINDLFEIERRLIAVGAEKRLIERREHSAPVVDQLVTWCRGVVADPSVGPRSLLAKAARYILNQEPRLRRFLENGRVPIHNNLTELQIRHFAVGRKNWLFYGSEAGSTWLTLVLSARMHGLHVETYFRDLFRVLPIWPKSRLLELAPHAWAATRARLSDAEMLPEFGPITIPARAT